MLKGYYFITDARLSRAGNEKDVKSALAAGVCAIQYRNKAGTTKQLYEEALRLRRACRSGVFLVNDRVDIALSVDADGVHLGQDDMPYAAARKILGKNKVIGLTVHDVRDAVKAQNMGADYVGVSPVFSTGTKTDAGEPVGIDVLAAITRRVSIPVIAIGGITLANAGQVIGAGASGLCAISAVVTKPDVKKEIQKFQVLFRK